MPLTPPRGPAPRLGQHNREVFQGILGLSDERIQQLEETQIIGDAYLEEKKIAVPVSAGTPAPLPGEGAR